MTDTNAPAPDDEAEVREITEDSDAADAVPVGPDETPDVREDEVTESPDGDGGDEERKP